MAQISSEEFARVEQRIMSQLDSITKKQDVTLEKIIISESRHEICESRQEEHERILNGVINNHDELAKTVQKLTPIIASFSILEKRIGGIITALILSAVGFGSNALLSQDKTPIKIEKKSDEN